MPEAVAEQKRLTRDDYYEDSKYISFSAIKVFSRCETLYRDIFLTKVYQEPERDYFMYGKLVDALVTEGDSYVADHFVMVDKKLKVEDALRYENEIKTYQREIDGLSSKIEAGNKTAIKGKESRLKKIEELEERLRQIRDIDGKEQITKSVWENAQQTALAIKSHPYYSSMTFDDFTSQQIMIAEINGVWRKGRLDHLKFCPSVEKHYKLYVANQITEEELRDRISRLPQADLWAVITDIKTCYDVAKLEPYNNHYRGQLGFYQDLVAKFTGIPAPNIKCQILAGDKVSNEFKKSELFLYSQESLDELKPDVEAWVQLWKRAVDTNTFTSAKYKKGFEQECYVCQECRFAPFSVVPGQPVLITHPRFGGKDAIVIDPEKSEEKTVEY